MNIQIKTKGIEADTTELQLLQAMISKRKLSIPKSKKGTLTVEKLFTSRGRGFVYKCGLEIKINDKCRVLGLTNGSNLTEAAKSAFKSALDQLAYITQLS